MGDRGQIFVKDVGVYLYTHWSGYELRQILKKSLERGKDRWDDPEYLSRIIFDDMINGDKGETGYGIGNTLHTDLDNPLITVDCGNEMVIRDGESTSFEDYTKKIFKDDDENEG